MTTSFEILLEYAPVNSGASKLLSKCSQIIYKLLKSLQLYIKKVYVLHNFHTQQKCESFLHESLIC